MACLVFTRDGIAPYLHFDSMVMTVIAAGGGFWANGTFYAYRDHAIYFDLADWQRASVPRSAKGRTNRRFLAWRKAVDRTVFEGLGGNTLTNIPRRNTFRFWCYGANNTALTAGLCPHPLGEPRIAYNRATTPDEYARWITNGLIQTGWCF